MASETSYTGKRSLERKAAGCVAAYGNPIQNRENQTRDDDKLTQEEQEDKRRSSATTSSILVSRVLFKDQITVALRRNTLEKIQKRKTSMEAIFTQQ